MVELSKELFLGKMFRPCPILNFSNLVVSPVKSVIYDAFGFGGWRLPDNFVEFFICYDTNFLHVHSCKQFLFNGLTQLDELVHTRGKNRETQKTCFFAVHDVEGIFSCYFLLSERHSNLLGHFKCLLLIQLLCGEQWPLHTTVCTSGEETVMSQVGKTSL